MTDITVPALGESVSEATIARWVKKQGEYVHVDEPLVELETDKVTLEINASVSGVVSEIVSQVDETVAVGQVIGRIEESAEAPAPVAQKDEAQPETSQDMLQTSVQPVSSAADTVVMSPAAQKILAENQTDPNAVAASGKGGRVTKADALAHVDQVTAPRMEMAINVELEATPASTPTAAPSLQSVPTSSPATPAEGEERVKMTRLRQRIAERLKVAQNTAAILTTFNEVDMSAVMELRSRVKERFEKKHGAKLGFMSFFAKACVTALKEIPEVNAEIQGDELVYKNHYDIGVAVGTEQGLVVPVVRGVDRLSFAGIEQEISNLALKARNGKLAVQDLTGGTFTISNGGVYGSLLSTPILNPPQSGILGMHKIQKRPVVVGDKVEVRPMMYLALSYDHRIIDGQGAVTFLIRVKECLEDPERMLLDV
ncbi:MAG: 2-oxoglutarate dehydrogenase complex dihydrolipoyllysine-residue succinyltransferase [bacterium]|nr:2-oxoglutarate dehydrogenase complex dihydrolipoyllysine-residue succinyltransferase [bacterium]